MTAQQDPTTDRADRFARDLAALKIPDPATARNGLWLRAGGALLLVGLVLGVLTFPSPTPPTTRSPNVTRSPSASPAWCARWWAARCTCGTRSPGSCGSGWRDSRTTCRRWGSGPRRPRPRVRWSGNGAPWTAPRSPSHARDQPIAARIRPSHSRPMSRPPGYWSYRSQRQVVTTASTRATGTPAATPHPHPDNAPRPPPAHGRDRARRAPGNRSPDR